ncbi:acyl-CoA dehydrogenase family protein [Gordonia sp. NPDC003376]
MTETLGSPTDVEWDPVLAELAERRNEFHELRHVPKDFIEKLKPLGVYRSATPARFGGRPMPPADFLRIVEKVATVDGSTGWVVAFASALTYLAALPLDTQAELYKDGPDVVYAGGLFPMQKAAETDKGYLVNGRWQFASGCMGADWIGVGLLDDAAGGRPRTAVLPAAQVEIVDAWDVSGMRASGSFDTIVRDVEVPREWTFVRGGPSLITDEPLFRYPVVAYQAQIHAAVGLGVAQAALGYAVDNGAYTGITGATPVGARAYYRLDVAKAYAALHSARSWYFDVADEVWQTLLAGDDITADQIARVRLSAVNVSDTSSQVVHSLGAVSGAAIIANSHPFNRLRLDAQVPQLHATLGQGIYDAAGAVLMGLEPTLPGFL